MRVLKMKWLTPRVNLIRCDGKDSGAPIPPGLVEYVGMLLGEKPDFHKVAALLNERLFFGKVRGFIYVRTCRTKNSFGCTVLTTKKILLQDRLFKKGVPRALLLKVLLQEMVHAYLDCSGVCRPKNAEHARAFRMEVERLQGILGIDVNDLKDVSEAVPLVEYRYECDRCGKEVVRSIKRQPDDLPNYRKHKSTCGGSFQLQQ